MGEFFFLLSNKWCPKLHQACKATLQILLELHVSHVSLLSDHACSTLPRLLQLAEPAQGAIYSWWPGNGFKWEVDGIYMVYWALWMKSITMHGYCVLFPIHPKQYEKVVLQCDVPLHVMICLPNMRLLEGC